MPVRYIISSVWVRLSIFSLLSIIQYVGMYVCSLPISLVMIGRIYIFCLIISSKSEVWTITHCLGLGNETMVSAVCLSIFSSGVIYLSHAQDQGPKNMYELLNLRAFKFSTLYENHIFQCMGKIFCVKSQRYTLKFHTKHLIHCSSLTI